MASLSFCGESVAEIFYLLGVVYVLVQIVLWFVFQMGEYTPIGIFDKVVQLLLVVLLVRYRKTGETGV